ncbi:unnamed protein product [Rotaria socialis]|uniref:Uncharacterized protein n=1 Tax=Rotaria socialis TaxID=392032 RepID=A0A820VLQ5_9BILA|nr:unnamed protein product [Rotaria socialis]
MTTKMFTFSVFPKNRFNPCKIKCKVLELCIAVDDASLSSSTTTSTTTTYRELKPSENNYHNDTVDIAQIVNHPSSVTN